MAQQAPQDSHRVSMLPPLPDSGVGPRADSWIRCALAQKRHMKFMRIQPGHYFLCRQILCIGIQLIRKGGSENRDHVRKVRRPPRVRKRPAVYLAQPILAEARADSIATAPGYPVAWL